jgi:FAD:protein FMN transferase
VIAVALAAGALLAAGAPARVERRLVMMGTELTLAVEGDDRPAALAAGERAVRALEATEARLSTWRADSELARLNRAAPGEPVAISAETAADLTAARRCWRDTGGAFDPTVGALVAAWGVRDGGRVPAPAERRAALAATGMDGVALAAAGARRERAGLVLDAGGFGKGTGLDRALAALPGPGVRRAWLDLGGQVAVWRADDEAEGWRLALADPDDRARPVVAVDFAAGSLATSGTSERGRHILDPRSGRPAADFGSLTVWAPEAARADCLSTGLYVLGPQAALAWAAARPDVEVIALTREGGRLRARATAGLAGRLTPLAPEVRVEFVRAAGGSRRETGPP